MLKLLVILLGILFIFIGVAGFLITFKQNGLLFGFFAVDLWHNLFHIITGVLAIMAATRYTSARFFLQLFGFIYTIIAIVGFWRGGDLFFTHQNLSDNILYLILGVIALYFGLSASSREV